MLKEFCGDFKLSFYNFRLIDNFISQTFERTNRGAALYYRTLKAAFNKAENWNYIPGNPFKKVKLPKLPQCLPAFITSEQLDQILSLTTRSDLKGIFLVAFYTGMRLSEILNLKWQSVDINTGMLHLKNTTDFTTKSKKERMIPIAKPLLNVITAMQNATNCVAANFLFVDKRNRKFNANFISKQFKKYSREAKLDENIHFHSLRHSFASNLVQRGASIFVVKELLGHEDINTTMIYSHLNQDSLKNAVLLL